MLRGKCLNRKVSLMGHERKERNRPPKPATSRRPPGTNSLARQTQTRLELPAGEPDLDGLRAVSREWLVPALVEKFLREHGFQPRSQQCIHSGRSPALEKNNIVPLIKKT
jgi:hypothetical protein